MSGIYIHIPFCKQACHYCDFHFSTSLKNKGPFLSALKKEITLQKNYFKNAPISAHHSFSHSHSDLKGSSFTLAKRQTFQVKSVYFGGGTPSLLSQKEILEIFDALNKYFSIDKNAEITLEANPDDLTKEKITELKNTPVNRLSIGIQSFYNDDLKLMNRAHNSIEAIESVKAAQDAGFENISIDLIYGTPTLTNEQWKKNLDIAFSLHVPHISSYCLTVEPKTALANFIKNGKVGQTSGGGLSQPVQWIMDDEKAAQQFEILIDQMEKDNFIHYEISNFSKDGFFAKHNSSYWKGEHYLGLGPSAHSYNGNSRQWNIANNNFYIKALDLRQAQVDLNPASQMVWFEKEILTEKDKYNEYVLTSLRTMWGCDLNAVKNNFGDTFLNHLLKNAEPYILQKNLLRNENILILAKSGKFISDKIVRDLFV